MKFATLRAQMSGKNLSEKYALHALPTVVTSVQQNGAFYFHEVFTYDIGILCRVFLVRR